MKKFTKLTITETLETITEVTLDATKFEALYKKHVAIHLPVEVKVYTKEEYLDSLLNGDITTDAEQDFYDDYHEVLHDKYPMPNQGVDRKFKLT